MRYFNYHNHSTYSIMDGAVTPDVYVDHIKKQGHTAACWTEHGNVFNWVSKKKITEAAGLKYVHAVEMYVTETLEEKVRDNYHVILIAKNYDGVKEINNLISLSTDTDHNYYKERASIDEIVKLSSNVIVTSACIGGVFAKAEKDSDVYKKLKSRVDYVEVQAHESSRQADYNIEMVEEFGIDKLIAATDSHAIDDDTFKARMILMQSKGVEYNDEGDFDIVMPTRQELKERFLSQGVFTGEQIDILIERTNQLEDLIEEFELDLSFKYPDLYDGEEYQIIRDICEGRIEDEKRFEHEMAVFEKLGMGSFMLFMSEITTFARDNNIPVGYGRGSAAGSYVSYLLGITDVDPIEYGLLFERFANKDRVSLGDIDVDFAPADREKVFEFINEKFGLGAARITTFTKLGGKSVLDLVGRAYSIPFPVVAEAKTKLNDLLMNPDLTIDDLQDAMQKFHDAFKHYKKMHGIVIARGIHAAGIVGSGHNLRETMGCVYDKSKNIWATQLEMGEIDYQNYVKFDILSIKSLAVVNDTYAGLMPMAHDINWDDQKVFKHMLESPVSLFQFESHSAFEYMKKFKPRSIEEISFLTAILRPGAASFRDDAVARKYHKNVDKRIDDILEETYGYLVYQEQQILFLQELCGFSASQADIVRRIIGKKKLKDLDEWLPKIEQGYVDCSYKPEKVAREEVKEFLQIFLDAGSYSFNKSHAVSYSMLTYISAMRRLYEPIRTVAAYLNNASNEDDIKSGTELAGVLGVEIKDPVYGKARASYSISDGVVYKGLASIHKISENVATGLYGLHMTSPDMSFVDLLYAVRANKVANNAQMEVLIKVNFFKEFAGRKKLIRIMEAYKKYQGKKRIKKEGITAGMLKAIGKLEEVKETKTYYQVDTREVLEVIYGMLKNEEVSNKEIVEFELSYLGYIQTHELLDSKYGYVEYVTKRGNMKVRNAFGDHVWYKKASGALLPVKNKWYTFEGVVNGTVNIITPMNIDRK